MISSLHGHVVAVGPESVTIKVGGVGYGVLVTGTAAQTLGTQIGSEVDLDTYLVVREDAMVLYGFLQPGERDTFDTLMTVKGIGPKLAMAALDSVGASELARAVHSQDLATLQRIPGVGKKTAQRLVLEIGDKLVVEDDLPDAPVRDADGELVESVTIALEQLGWPRPVASRVVDQFIDEHKDVESLLRAALGHLGANRGT